MTLPDLRPISIKERVSLVFVEKGQIDVLDGAFVVVDVNGIRTQVTSTLPFAAGATGVAPGCGATGVI